MKKKIATAENIEKKCRSCSREVSQGVLNNDSITGGSIQSQKGMALKAAAHLHL